MWETWKIVLKPGPDRVEALLDFLDAHLDRRYSYRLGHGGRVVIEEGLRTKDECWQVAEWVRHRFDPDLQYGIVGYKGSRIAYTSHCPACREGRGPHYEHTTV